MKKNRMMRIASVLLVAVLLTTCAISGTFAKYVTNANSTDTARVAVWGINGDAVTMELFKKEYDSTVSSDDKVIAPGTSGSSQFSIINTSTVAPEVSYEVAVDVSASEIDESIKNNGNITWKLDDGAYGTWDALMDSIKALSGDATGKKTYNPGEFADAFTDGKTHTISWNWAFSTSAAQDEIDTNMGNAAVEGDLNVKLVVSITATQID